MIGTDYTDRAYNPLEVDSSCVHRDTLAEFLSEHLEGSSIAKWCPDVLAPYFLMQLAADIASDGAAEEAFETMMCKSRDK